jgi:hypothetical protein
MFIMFITWRDGRQKLRAELEARAVSDKKLPELLAKTTKVPGTSVFLVSQSGYVPTALLRNLEHNKVHHEQIVILHIEIQRVPRIDPMARVLFSELYAGVYDVRARFGFMETPDVGEGLAQRAAPGPERVCRGLLVLPRVAPGARASAPGAGRAQDRVPLHSCSAAVRRPRNSSACPRVVSWCWPPTSKSNCHIRQLRIAGDVVAWMTRMNVAWPDATHVSVRASCPAGSDNFFVAMFRPAGRDASRFSGMTTLSTMTRLRCSRSSRG